MLDSAESTPSGCTDLERKPLVLCVDDDSAVLSALRRQLRGEPYNVVTSPSAAQALAALRGQRIEVVVSDERMPGTNGSELLAEVRERWPWVGRIILTAYPGQEILIRGLEAGVDFVMMKPWDEQVLKKTLRCLIHEVDRSHPRSPEKTSGEAGAEGIG